MGVKTLWSVIGGAGEPTDLRELEGKSVAIDLAGWAVSGNQCKGMHRGGVAKPHLRNLFFRTSALIGLNIKPVFVLDGRPPELKQKNPSRNRLNAVMKECSDLLVSLGVRFVRADGEAESYAAQMNAQGLVDAVVTDDSDSFCYGAKTVLRNFSISGNSVELFKLEKLETHLNLNRRRLIFMAAVLGCDFCPSGIPKLGKETVKSLLESWPLKWDPLDIMEMWRRQEFPRTARDCSCLRDSGGHCGDCDKWREKIGDECHCRFIQDKEKLKVEETFKKRCKEFNDQEFWEDVLPRVVDEFERDKTISKKKKKKGSVGESTSLSESKIYDLPETSLFAKCPDLKRFISIAVGKLSWTEEYAVEKFLPVLAKWQVIEAGRGDNVLIPDKIVKKKTVNGKPGYLVDWAPCDLAGPMQPFQSTESAEHLMAGYPELVNRFEQGQPKKKKGRGADKRPRVNSSHQKPITNFFTASPIRKKPKGTESDLYRKVFLQSPAISSTPLSREFKTPIPLRTRVLQNLDNLNDTPFDPSMSILVDEIIETPKAGPKIANSTPAGASVFSRDSPIPDDFEDSFDRMCL